MVTDESNGRNDEWIQYPGMPGLCRACVCLEYELAHEGLAASLYIVLDIVFTVIQSLICSTLRIALTPGD